MFVEGVVVYGVLFYYLYDIYRMNSVFTLSIFFRRFGFTATGWFVFVDLGFVVFIVNLFEPSYFFFVYWRIFIAYFYKYSLLSLYAQLRASFLMFSILFNLQPSIVVYILDSGRVIGFPL